jgi:integration host factor subunit beta
MTKSELIRKVQERISDYPSRDVAYAVLVVFDAMVRALIRGERIEIRDFGNITVRHRRSIRGRNPKTSDIIELPPRKIPFFKVGKELYDMINGRKGL